MSERLIGTKEVFQNGTSLRACFFCFLLFPTIDKEAKENYCLSVYLLSIVLLLMLIHPDDELLFLFPV